MCISIFLILIWSDVDWFLVGVSWGLEIGIISLVIVDGWVVVIIIDFGLGVSVIFEEVCKLVFMGSWILIIGFIGVFLLVVVIFIN